MRSTFFIPVFVLLPAAAVLAAPAAPVDLQGNFDKSIHPFLQTYCAGCHNKQKHKGDFDLTPYNSTEQIAKDERRWALVLDKLKSGDMQPEEAKKQTTPEYRQQTIDWIIALRNVEAQRNAGDPGIVLAHRLSNAEYNYTIRDLTGVDIQPTKEFPVDPANEAGFDNSGESLAMSPSLLNKYLLAARDVANHAALIPEG